MCILIVVQHCIVSCVHNINVLIGVHMHHSHSIIIVHVHVYLKIACETICAAAILILVYGN